MVQQRLAAAADGTSDMWLCLQLLRYGQQCGKYCLASKQAEWMTSVLFFAKRKSAWLPGLVKGRNYDFDECSRVPRQRHAGATPVSATTRAGILSETQPI